MNSRVEVRRGLAQQDREVRGVERHRGAAVVRVAERREEQVGVTVEEVEVVLAEGQQPLARRARPGRAAAGRRSARSGSASCARRAARARGRRGRRSGGRACRCRRTPRAATSSIETCSMPRSCTSVVAAQRICSRLRVASARSRGTDPPPSMMGSCAAATGTSCRLDRAPTSRTRSPSRSPRRSGQLGVLQAAVVGERAVGHADRQLALQHVRAAGLEHLAHLGLRPDGAEQAGARADHDRDGLSAQRRCRGTGARPSRARSSARRGRVALYSGVAIRSASALSISSRSAWTTAGGVGLEVLVEGGQVGEAVPLDRARPRTAACPPPPGAACGCGSPGAGCRRCRGSASD